MKRLVLGALVCLIAAPIAHTQQTKSPEIVRIFRGVSPGRARVPCASWPTARRRRSASSSARTAGSSAKHSELKGKKLTCLLPTGRA